jgi:hypothetical protein
MKHHGLGNLSVTKQNKIKQNKLPCFINKQVLTQEGEGSSVNVGSFNLSMWFYLSGFSFFIVPIFISNIVAYVVGSNVKTFIIFHIF